MAGIAGQIAAQGVNADFVAVAETLFSNPNAWGPWRTWAGELPMDGTSLVPFMVGPTGPSAEISGERKYQMFRYHARQVPAKRYGPPAISIDKLLVENDKSGAVQKRLRDYLSDATDLFGKPANDFLISNPTSFFDGVALISASHLYDSGGSTWTNDSTTALSAAELAVVVQAMRGRLSETGVSLGIMPTHLMVPPGLEQLAIDITGSVRPVGVGTAGGQVTAAAIAGVQMPNWLAGKLDVIVNPYMTSGTWFVMALGNPSVRPIYYGLAEAPRAHVVDQPESANMVNRSEYVYYAEGRAAFIGGVPQSIYGKDT